jgi:hypothetical protein
MDNGNYKNNLNIYYVTSTAASSQTNNCTLNVINITNENK